MANWSMVNQSMVNQSHPVHAEGLFTEPPYIQVLLTGARLVKAPKVLAADAALGALLGVLGGGQVRGADGQGLTAIVWLTAAVLLTAFARLAAIWLTAIAVLLVVVVNRS